MCVCCLTPSPVSHSPFHSNIVFNSTFLKLFFSFSFIYSCFVYYHFVYSPVSSTPVSSTPVSSTPVSSTQLFAPICSIVMIYQFLSSSFSTPSLLSLLSSHCFLFLPLLLTFSPSSIFFICPLFLSPTV